MDSSLRTVRWLSVLLIFSGCAPSAGHEALSPIAPTSLSGGGTAALSSGSPAAVSQLAPAVSYDATGSWHVTILEGPRGPVGGEFDVLMTQNADGDITFSDDTATFTFTRRGPGNGRMIAYALSAYGPIVLPNSPCETRLSGNAVLDTQTDTMTVRHFSGVEDDCTAVSGAAIVTRN